MDRQSGGIKKIAVICMQYPPEKGAAASRLAKMATGLQNRRIDVSVITALPNYPTGRIFPDYRRKFSCSEVIDDIPVKRYWLYPSNSSNAVRRILNMCSFSVSLLFALPYLIRKRPDAIIVNSPPLLVGLSGVLIAKLLRCPVIGNVSDIWPLSALELGAMRRNWFYALLEKVERFVYRFSNAIMAQSNETLAHVRAVCPEKQSFLYRNLDYASEFPDQSPPVDHQDCKLIYAGLLGVAQGVYEICTSINFKAISTEFHIYGDGNERAKVNQYISENPDCNIFLHDSVPKTDMPEILSRFHATIVPLKGNIHGAFPSKIYMAISAALPVLFCGSGEGADFVREHRIGWIGDPGDYAQLRRNIEALSSLTALDFQSLRNRIRSLAATSFDPDDQLDRLVDFINGID